MQIVDSLNESQWGRIVYNSSFATFFQTPQCYQFYKDVPFLEAFAYGIENEGDSNIFYLNYARSGLLLALKSLHLPKGSKVGVMMFNCIILSGFDTGA